jgi:hypothetical protein
VGVQLDLNDEGYCLRAWFCRDFFCQGAVTVNSIILYEGESNDNLKSVIKI